MQHVAGVAYFPECTRSRDHDDGGGAHSNVSQSQRWVVRDSAQLP